MGPERGRPHGGPRPDDADRDAPPLFPGLNPRVDLGLGRITEALAGCGDPHRRYASVHVGGTNGKGSTAATIAAVLRAAGLRVGLYTSPHLVAVEERFRVDGRCAARADLDDLARQLAPLAAELGLTEFEALTLLAFGLFADRAVDVAVVEVGLGGRLDATNVLRPLVSVIANVAHDHEEYLGTGLEAIAAEKAGIVKPGVPVVTGPLPSEALAVISAVARERSAHLVPWDPGAVGGIVPIQDGTTFHLATGRWGALSLHTPLCGQHQVANVATAVRALEALEPSWGVTASSVAIGVRETRWHGRMHLVQRSDGPWFLDVAHNPDGVAALGHALLERSPPRPWTTLVSILADKPWSAMLEGISGWSDHLVVTSADSAPAARKWDPFEVERWLGPEWPIPVSVAPRFADGFERARSLAGAGTVVATGSVHTVGDAMFALGVRPCSEG